MTFPFTFPIRFGENPTSATTPGLGVPITGWWAELFGTAAATITPTAAAAGSLPHLARATITPAASAAGFLTVFKGAAATVTPTTAAGGYLTLLGTAASTVTPAASTAGAARGAPAATVTPTAAASGYLTVLGTAAATVSPTAAAAGAGTGAAAATVTPAPTTSGQAVGVAAATVTPSPATAGIAQGSVAATVTPAPSAAGGTSGGAAATVTPSATVAGVVTPTYDNSAKSARQVTLASGTAFTWSSGAGSTAGAYGIVFIPCQSGLMDLGATAAVTWGGTTMTSLGSRYNNNNSTFGWGWVFTLPSVAAGGAGIPGGAQTISVTLTQAGKTFTGYGASFSYNNVVSVGTLQTAFGTTTTNPSVAVTAANAVDLVWGAILTNSAALSGFSMTSRQNTTIAPVFSAGDTTGSTTISGTATATGWSAFGLDLQ